MFYSQTRIVNEYTLLISTLKNAKKQRVKSLGFFKENTHPAKTKQRPKQTKKLQQITYLRKRNSLSPSLLIPAMLGQYDLVNPFL